MNETQNRIILKLGTNVEDDNTHVGNFNMEGEQLHLTYLSLRH